MLSLAFRRALDAEVELWLTRLFTAAELAAADLLLQLSVAGAGGGDEAAESSSSGTTYSSRRSESLGLVDLTAEEGVEERVVQEPALSTELDRRARKRFRLLSELYAATAPVTCASPAAAGKRKRKRHHLHEDSTSSESFVEEATRYGGDY